MRTINYLTNDLGEFSLDYNRRQFIHHAGKGIFAATVLSEFPSLANTPQTGNSKTTPDDLKPIQLKPLEDPSEKKDGSLPNPLQPEKRIGYAIVGLGHLSLAQILPAFGSCKYSKPVALVSGDAAKAQTVAAQYGIPVKNIYNYQNFDEIKNNPEVDVVYIVLPNSMHAEFTIRAAKAGKHVLCEKPMATSVKDCERMIEACKTAGKQLMIAYRIQYEPHHKLVKDWVRNKEYGKVRLIEAFNAQNIGDPTQWRLKKSLSGGGSLPDIGLYCLNTARYLIGEEPVSVLATIYSTPNDPRFKEVEETVMFQMHFPNGTQVNSTTSYGVHESRRYRCYADKGGWFGLDPAFPYKGLKMEVSQARDAIEWKSNPSLEEKDQFALEMDHMSQCVRNNKKPFTPGEEGLQDQRIMDAIYESAHTGKIVKLETIKGLDIFRGTPPENK
ncbi:Gfo/Idh/MocA family oxidoreductase [Pedobacter sp. HMF7647]|uniref:Gfo/Idh/MocA family oxidoreductase n=1 Tax=Hufsiella arboris TaxID=2695275 RepID=A0A7K1YAE3_9SPHI|nr:Gfo/Idh/MocA family oxidoreductase [Hufsiella arboris]MXV51400.1 Gfo/Idh/MocA family oxidoreductase [Hufsiella arboris]